MEAKKLATIADKIMVGIASAATHAYRPKGVPMFRNLNIKSGILDDSDLLFLAPEFESVFKNKRLRPGDLITMRTGYPGATAIVPDRYDSAQSFTTLITRPKPNEVDGQYLCHYINSENGQRFFVQSQIGGAQKNVNAGTLREMPVPQPSALEQRAIASALSDMDNLLNGLERLIAKKRDLKQAAMQQLLTGQTRLPGFKGEWEIKSIGDSIDLLTGYPFPSVGYTNNGIRLLRGSNVKRGVTDWSEDLVYYWPEMTPDIARYELREGDLVISMDGSLVGRSFARLQPNDLPAVLLQRVARIRSSELDIGYLTHFVGSEIFIRYCDSVKTVTAIPHISASDIRNFRIPVPSD